MVSSSIRARIGGTTRGKWVSRRLISVGWGVLVVVFIWVDWLVGLRER